MQKCGHLFKCVDLNTCSHLMLIVHQEHLDETALQKANSSLYCPLHRLTTDQPRHLQTAASPSLQNSPHISCISLKTLPHAGHLSLFFLLSRDVHRRGLRLLGQLPVCPPRLKLPLRRKYIYFLNSITAAELHVGLDKIIAE